MAIKVIVNIPNEAPYDVRIGAGQLEGVGAKLRAVSAAPDAFVLTDSTVGPLYLEPVRASLKAAGFRTVAVTVPAGEESKSVACAAELWQAMADAKLGRDALVVALGGGVVGDIAGFVASTYMRGVPFVQVPTTLLAMVDSSVGGKTGINLDAGKNLVGTFCQPLYVCASTDTLATLDEREWACGCGEVAKSAAVEGDDFFFWLMEHAERMAARDPEVVTEAIARCVTFKADVVARATASTRTATRSPRACASRRVWQRRAGAGPKSSRRRRTSCSTRSGCRRSISRRIRPRCSRA